MELSDILSVERVAVGVSVSSKKSLLEKVSELLALAPDAAPAREIFESLCQRERLGSTGLGKGVAIPHGRVAGQTEVSGAVLRLLRPIEFDSPDGEKVDLFFALAVPEQCTDEHLRLLARIAARFGNEAERKALRTAETAGKLHELIIAGGDPDQSG